MPTYLSYNFSIGTPLAAQDARYKHSKDPQAAQRDPMNGLRRSIDIGRKPEAAGFSLHAKAGPIGFLKTIQERLENMTIVSLGGLSGHFHPELKNRVAQKLSFPIEIAIGQTLFYSKLECACSSKLSNVTN